MSRSIFDQVLVQPQPQRSRRWITVGSILAHVVALLVIFVWPLTAAARLPAVHTPLTSVVLAQAELPPPEPDVAPAPTVETPTVNPDAAPIEAPDAVLPEVEPPVVSVRTPVPGGLPGIGRTTGINRLLSDRSLGRGMTPPPPPPDTEPRRVGGVVDAPVRTHYVAPEYPQVASSARIEGMVILEATISATGVVQNVSVLRSVPLLDRAAIEAVRKWRYTPTRLNGQPIAVIMTVTVTFSLK